MVLTAIFILSLAATVVHAVIEARQERKPNMFGNSSSSHSEWSEVATALDLEIVRRTGMDDPLLRGSISGHWISVEQTMKSIEIDVHYLSGVEPFRVTELSSITAGAVDRIETGDDAFDSELVVFSDYPDDLTDYLSPARRNALLWLKSSFEVSEIDDEDICVRFVSESWKADDLISAIELLVDVAEIMQTGQKVFMAPPTIDSTALEVIDGGLS